MLAVEVISPSSGPRDGSLKKAVYERMGVPAYWIEGISYREAAAVTGSEVWNATSPFPVQVIPADLTAGLQP